MASQGKILNLNPNYVGDPAAIDAQNKALTTDVQNFGTSQDQNISNIYNELGGQLTSNAASVQDIYNQGNKNLSDAYNQAGVKGSSDLAGILAQLRGSGATLGSGGDAINAVMAGAGKQAADYSVKNTQKLTERLGANTQLGTNMTALAKLGVASAAKAAAQGKKELSDRIIQQVQSLNSAAMLGKGSYYHSEAVRQEKEAAQALAEVMRQQHEAAADARANAASARADARASRSRGSDGPSWGDKFAAQNAEHDRRWAAEHGEAPMPNFGLGERGNAAAAALYKGASLEDAQRLYKTPKGNALDWDEIQRRILR